MSKNYNTNHDYDLDEPSIKKRIDEWNKCQLYEEKIMKCMEKNSATFFEREKDFQKWESKELKEGSIRKVNKARDKMIQGLTMFLDGFGSLKKESGDWITDPDFLNIIFATAFSKSDFYDKTRHWSKAEKEFQKSRNTSLPGGISGNGDEEIQRDNDEVWYSLQFLYRQFEFTRFVPNYEIISGIWDLENKLDTSTVALIDRWYYIHKDQIQIKQDLTDFTKGYFFRYNAKMTSESQAQTLYILNNLFRYSMSKPVGTFEYPPWFRDSTITGNSDGNLPFSKNIVPHKIDTRVLLRIKNSPIIGEEIAGMQIIPNEPENYEEFEDKNIAKLIVSKNYKQKEDLEKDIKINEVSRGGKKGYYRGEENMKQEWDQDDIEIINLPKHQGRMWVQGNKILKIKNADGEKVSKIKLKNGTKYTVDGDYLERSR